MGRLRRVGAACVAFAAALLLAGAWPARAVVANLDREQIDEALIFARQATREERRAYHEAYLRAPGDRIRRISVVTEHRRVVLFVEEKLRLSERSYGQRQAMQLLTPWRGLVEVIVELQFHPQNTYIGVPLIDVLAVRIDEAAPGAPLVPAAVDRRPHFGVFWAPTPMDAPWWPYPPTSTPVIGRTEPLTGGWLLARFDAAPLATGRWEIVVKDGASTLGTGEFNMSALK